MTNGRIQNAMQRAQTDNKPQSIASLVNSRLESDGYNKRLEQLLGERKEQFISSMVSVITGNAKLQEAFLANPGNVVACGVQAAAYDLPLDPALGFAYIVPYGNKATFVMGFRGMIQMALRSGAYEKINVVEVMPGEIKRYDRMREDIEIEFIEDEEERSKLTPVGWVGYFRLVNGMEKTIYMSRKQIDEHERKHRKGAYMSTTWRDYYNEMAAKTVLRRLLSKWGILSVSYQKHADPETMQAASAVAAGDFAGVVGMDVDYTVSDEDAAIVAELDAEAAAQQEAEA